MQEYQNSSQVKSVSVLFCEASVCKFNLFYRWWLVCWDIKQGKKCVHNNSSLIGNVFKCNFLKLKKCVGDSDKSDRSDVIFFKVGFILRNLKRQKLKVVFFFKYSKI